MTKKPEVKYPFFQAPVRSIFEKFSREKDVSLVYGEPIIMKNKQVLPVAKVNYFVGGGSGGQLNEEQTVSIGQGEGGGGAFSIKPIGVYEITDKKVKFKPILPINLILTFVAVMSFGLVLLIKKKR